jgi:hypothetical protein
MRLPPDRLPEGDAERHALLRTYFCDKDAIAFRDESGWRLELDWPDGADRHVDPRLEQGLAWWQPGLRRAGMALQHRRQGRVLTSLYDTWTLHSWSEWLARDTRRLREPHVILHVDDHFDLGSPRLLLNPNNDWTDAITHRLVSIVDPASVRAAIESGAIGMGSFLTPWLFTANQVDVRHLCRPPKSERTERFVVTPSTQVDELLAPGTPRLAIALNQHAAPTGLSYRRTPDVGEWSADLGSGPILIHIDMDYFNNRYDGDSDWANRDPRFNASSTEISAKIDELADTLCAPHIASRIEDIVIAYSPGFFPAEYWQQANEQLERRLRAFYES